MTNCLQDQVCPDAATPSVPLLDPSNTRVSESRSQGRFPRSVAPTRSIARRKYDASTILVALGPVLALVACANSSGVAKIGPETFTISTSASPGKGGVPAAKRIAYKEAADECSRRGLEVFTLSEKTASPTWTEGMASMELNFRCLRPDDPEFQRQHLQSSPDRTIEIRQR